MSRPDFIPVPADRDPRLWKIAQLRASFKAHLSMYLLINTFLIGIWYFTGRDYFWPIWPLLGWGLGVAIHGFRAYTWQGTDLVEEEYRKLKGQ